MTPTETYDPRIAGLDADVVYFPVRHHSPAAARLVEEAILRVRPRAVLIEGPSDYAAWPELLLAHRPPIALYSYVAWSDGVRRGAFYPFCIYSPEWHAIQVAAQHNIHAEFIDLPWADTARDTRQTHAYADGDERRANYILSLVDRLGLDDFDDLWDRFFEVDRALTLDAYLDRCHSLMAHVRRSQPVAALDQRREHFMAARIRHALERKGAPVLVITGAYHSWALFTGAPEPPPAPAPDDVTIIERGIALTPYSYERLDSLTGYESGMPNPGFYHRVWQDRSTQADTFRALLSEVIRSVRATKQQISAADLIAVESMARGLATLRGQDVCWRRELVDGIRGALIKDDLIRGFHPLLSAVNKVLRGNERGTLARGTRLPPLVADIHRLIEQHSLILERHDVSLTLDLTKPADLARARVLHQLRGLSIAGCRLVSGGKLDSRDDVTQVVETWALRWSEEFDATCIERSVYGPALADASHARLEEQARNVDRSAGAASTILLEAALQGHAALAASFQQKLSTLIHEDSDFASITSALNTLIYLYRYDDVLQTTRATSGVLLVEAYRRGLWLIEAMGPSSEVFGCNVGIGLLKETLERCGQDLSLDRDEFVAIFLRLAANAVAPFLRGASSGVVWSLAALPADRITLPLTAQPQDLGDFLAGLFSLARETVQRHPDLVRSIDELLMSFDDEVFLEALPSLRLAFSPFTPREKHHIVQTLLGPSAAPMPKLAVSIAEATRALAWESRVFRELARHGVLSEPTS